MAERSVQEIKSHVNSKVDVYGFERPEDFDYETYEQFMAAYLNVLTRRAIKWSHIVGAEPGLSKNSKLKRFVRKGIPTEHRPIVWMYVSGAGQHMAANPTLYQELLAQTAEQEVTESIKKDIPRTFPDNIYFQDTPTDPEAKRTPLQNVLLALANKHQSVGYCQGMNFIAGLILLIMKDEEKTFWLMDTLLSDILPDYYSRDMMGVQVDQEVLGQLVKARMPDVHALLDKHGMAWGLIASKWFICLYADVIPVETVLRIWDSLFYEGSKILFRVGVTLIKINRKEILKCRNFTDITNVTRDIPKSTNVMKCHEFMQSVFKEPGSFPMGMIDRWRVAYRKHLTSS